VLRTGRRSRPLRADVAQLVAHHLAKVRVAGSNPVVRSKVQVASILAVEWPSGEATACKAVHTGSIPVSTSIVELRARLAQRESASLTRKRSLVQSQYRAPSINAGQRLYLGSLCNRRGRYVKYPRLQTHPTRLEPVRLPLLSQCRVALQFESAQSQCPYRPSRIGVGPRRTRKLRQPEPRCGVRWLGYRPIRHPGFL
jgi:hypothetical protein